MTLSDESLLEEGSCRSALRCLKPFSASRLPAAVQRHGILAFRDRFTFRQVWRITRFIDSMIWVRAREQLAKGQAPTRIAREMGISRGTVYKAKVPSQYRTQPVLTCHKPASVPRPFSR